MHLEVLHRAHAQAEDAAGISISATGPFTEQMLAKVKTIVPLVWRCVPCAGTHEFMLQVPVHRETPPCVQPPLPDFVPVKAARLGGMGDASATRRCWRYSRNTETDIPAIA